MKCVISGPARNGILAAVAAQLVLAVAALHQVVAGGAGLDGVQRGRELLREPVEPGVQGHHVIKVQEAVA